MVTFVRTNLALPGKLFELLAVAKEIAAVVKGLTERDLVVCSAFGGNPAEVAWIWQVDSIAQLEANGVKVMADAEYRTALNKLENLVVPGSARDQIWMHV
jgi:UDP-N-acetylmuramyl tripeptide synthase